MADIDAMLDKLMEDSFRPLPDRQMYGKTYQNIPPGRKYSGKNPDEFTQPFDPSISSEDVFRFLHTFENKDSPATFWQLKEFLGS